MNDSAFESWYNGMVGFHINSERILDDMNYTVDYNKVDPETVRKWMVVCWNNAIDAAINVCWLENEVPDLEALKERS